MIDELTGLVAVGASWVAILMPVLLVWVIFHFSTKNDKDKYDLLFRFIQFIERQVVLFDAIEDAAFPYVNNMHGRGTLRNIKEEAQKNVYPIHSQITLSVSRCVLYLQHTQHSFILITSLLLLMSFLMLLH